ncbi:hypothetical protein [uncultured Desulfovibrio sp.]|uniref:acyl carrier protein n=1 Tax=uncultured Desulfovibrio sp. TaxID=167968 RepID=UPI0026392603|nr:hypothetical protein [uncultured Desulfovibrio sp.]
MNEKEKLAALEEMMEMDEGTLSPEASLSEIEEWDSLAALSYVVFMSDEFGRKMSGAQVRSFKTVKDILDTMELEA